MKCIAPKLIWPHRSIEWQDKHEEYPVSVPCGKCLVCLSNKRKEWAFRLEQEHKYSKKAEFITLTYDQKHLPFLGSLCKEHLQNYLKRLRKQNGENRIRYYAVGEYGSASMRPHYHILLFNAENCTVRSAWCDRKGNSIGLVHCGSVNAASVAYVLKYMVQPFTDLPYPMEKPFSVMSRAFGIGARYLTDTMVAWHREDDRLYCMRENVKTRLPRFYKTKIWYNEEKKEAISRAALLQSLESSRIEEQFYKDRYGAEWQEKMVDFRDSYLSRIKSKVAYTQTL